jgi:hypothetical protein
LDGCAFMGGACFADSLGYLDSLYLISSEQQTESLCQ